jgi:glycosyltransferase A (GT-A) superfamily protein (DUF2064 family)
LAGDLVIPVVVLVVAKAPVPGQAKTRLAAGVGDQAAADIAAAALLDTLDAVAVAPVEARVVALTGNLDESSNSDEIRTRLADFTVVEQRGSDFAHRLANAHLDAAAVFTGLPVLQIGMDTPQVTADLIAECARELLASDAVLGPARDGGWWALGVAEAAMADCVRAVPMSRSDTGVVTLAALRDTGVDVSLVPALADVDTVDDIDAVRRACAPGSRFARATQAAGA